MTEDKQDTRTIELPVDEEYFLITEGAVQFGGFDKVHHAIGFIEVQCLPDRLRASVLRQMQRLVSDGPPEGNGG